MSVAGFKGTASHLQIFFRITLLHMKACHYTLMVLTIGYYLYNLFFIIMHIPHCLVLHVIMCDDYCSTTRMLIFSLLYILHRVDSCYIQVVSNVTHDFIFINNSFQYYYHMKVIQLVHITYHFVTITSRAWINLYILHSYIQSMFFILIFPTYILLLFYI